MGGFIDMDKICHPFSRPFPRDPDKRNIKKGNPCIVLIETRVPFASIFHDLSHVTLTKET